MKDYKLSIFNVIYIKIRSKIPKHLLNQIELIKIKRLGKSLHSYMICTDILGYISNDNNIFEITHEGLDPIQNIKNLEENYEKNNLIPKKLSLISYHLKEAPDINLNNKYNIFGKNQILISELDELQIPIIQTTNNNLNYFGAELYKINDTIEFKAAKEIFITKITIGKDYVKNYLMLPELGNGCYIEKHDTEHYHQPLKGNCSGYYILAKQKDNHTFEFGAFTIPFGFGIYTHPNTYHTDSFLIGEYIVAYGLTTNYKTLNIYNKDNDIVNLIISRC